MSVQSLDRIHHLLLFLLSLLVAAALYRFATTLLSDLPWPSALP
ncbi:hypothetical protein [Haloplanus pelagicus]|jgi:hypothetical protein|nr:hypothetical protein [Haloplanus sp. HW8-1]